MDRQAAFDTVARGVLRQGTFGAGHGGSFYRTTDGKKCGIGFLIADMDYDDALEDCNVSQLPPRILDVLDVETADDLAFLTRLQQLHDEAAARRPPDMAAALADWRRGMRDLAGAYGLSVTAVDDPSPSKR